jgi:hypothetical protein
MSRWSIDVLDDDLHLFYKRCSSNAPWCSPARSQHALDSIPWSRNDHCSQGDGSGIGLSTDLDTLVIGEVDVFCGVEGHKYGTGKTASIIVVVVAAIVAIIAVVRAEKSGVSSC